MESTWKTHDRKSSIATPFMKNTRRALLNDTKRKRLKNESQKIIDYGAFQEEPKEGVFQQYEKQRINKPLTIIDNDAHQEEHKKRVAQRYQRKTFGKRLTEKPR